MAMGEGDSPQLWDRDNPEQQGSVFTEEQFKELLSRKCVRPCELVTMSSMWPALRQLKDMKEEELKMDNAGHLSIFKLLELLEESLLRRGEQEVSQEQLKQFYQMSMHGLLKGWKEFSEEALSYFDIAEECLVFFVKKETVTATSTHVAYSFPHILLHKYFAGRYIESLSLQGKKTLLLSICSNPSFRNLQRIMFDIISQQLIDQHVLLQTMLRAILILQHQDIIDKKETGFFQRQFTLYGKLVNLHKHIQPTETLDISMLEVQSDQQEKEIDRTWDMINQAFCERSNELKDANWYRGLGNGVFGHITECLQICPEVQRLILTKNTTKVLLPCIYTENKGHRFVCAIGESHWAEVTCNRKKDQIVVNAWTVEDAKEALYQARESAFLLIESHMFDSLTLNINEYRNLWGQPPSSSPSPLPDLYSTPSEEELRHWLPMCKRHCFVCAVGETRWAEVNFNTSQDDLSVTAWTVEDAREALCRARLSVLPASMLHKVGSLTLDMSKYRDLWGQPPKSSPLPDIRSQHSFVMGLWLPACESYHFVFSTGASRHAKVTFNRRNYKIVVHSWGLEDARDVLYQVRMSDQSGSHQYDSMSICVDKYKKLWGLPESTPSVRKVYNKLGEELEQWSHICGSCSILWREGDLCYFVCKVGADRYGQVVYQPGEFLVHNCIRVHAWCVEDAQEALYQYRMSAATSHEVQDIWWFDLNIDLYHSLWGQPTIHSFIPDVWTALSAEVASHWSDRCKEDYHYNIYLRNSSPIYGLLQSGMTIRVQNVDSGTIYLKDLHKQVQAGQLKHVKWLLKTDVVVHDCTHKDEVSKMRYELAQANGAAGKLLRRSHFVTEREEDYVTE